jgi:DNA-binding XRE family transcriptional regulator
MSDQGAEDWWAKEIAATGYRNKLRQARERRGLTQHQAAATIDYPFGDSAYYDIENCDYDLTSCYCLNEIKRICEFLGIHPKDLFCDETTLPIPISEVVEKIKTHCTQLKLSIDAFEDIAGWKLESCYADPSNALKEWNVDCLIDVSRELGIDWRRVIAGL